MAVNIRYADEGNTYTTGGNIVWTKWCETSNATSTTCYTHGNAVWVGWCNSDTSTATTATTYTSGTWTVWNTKYEETAEQKAKREREAAERAAEYARKAEEERKLREQAHQTARKLLLENLNAEQRKSESKGKFFDLRGPSGTLYRIETERTHGNVFEIDETGKKLRKFCVQPNNVPLGDALLAQKLHIEHNEEHFVRTANITRLTA